MKKTRLCDLLGIRYPIIEAPMNWLTGAGLAAVVSSAGGLGCLGPNLDYKTVTTDVKETGERLRTQIRRMKKLTDKPFAVNFSARSGEEFKESMKYCDAWAEVALEEGIRVALLSGTNPEVYTRRFKDAGMKVLHRPIPCTVAEARKAEAAGVDAVIAVGFDAGGHSGIYQIPTFVLMPQVVDAVKIPVVAGGGIADARGLVAALALGAEGVFIGTAFMATTECPTHPRFKQAMIDAGDTATMTWLSLNGVTRVMRSPLSERYLAMIAKGEATPADIAGIESSEYPKGVLQGDIENGLLVAGADVGLIKQVMSAAEFMQSLITGADKIIAGLK